MDARAGQGGLVLVAGEPGIGKTRLLSHVGTWAGTQGVLVLSGRAYETEGMPPYLPFVEAIRSYVLASPADELALRLGDGAPEVALLVREIRDRLSALPVSPTVVREQFRYRLFESITDFLVDVARSSPSGLLLLLDDLQWADQPTLLLLQHLARKLTNTRLLVACGYRTVDLGRTHPLADTLAALSRERLARRIRLTPFAHDETVSLIAALIGKPPADRVITEMEREAEGNPFFLEELVGHLSAEGRDLADDSSVASQWAIPESVRQVIGGRLSRLSADANRMLHACVVLGDGLEFDVLAPVSGLDESRLLDALYETLVAGVLREEHGCYFFRHALIRQTIEEELTLPRKQRLHLRAAEAIEMIYATSLEPFVAALARHYRLAGTATARARSIDYAQRAGDAAMAIHAYEEAATHWQAALESLDNQPSFVERRAQLLERLGDLMYLTSIAHASGIDYLEEALSLYESIDQHERAAEIHGRLGRTFAAGFTPAQHIPTALQHLRAAEQALATGPVNRSLAHTYIGLASAAYYDLRIRDALQASARALDIGESLGDESIWAHSAVFHGWSLVLLGHVSRGLALLEKAASMADRLRLAFVGFLAALLRGQAHSLLLDPLGAQRVLEQELAKPRLAQSPMQRGGLSYFLAEAHLLGGTLDQASAESAELGHMRHRLRATVCFYTGDLTQAAEHARLDVERCRSAGNRWLEHTMVSVLAGIARSQGAQDRARALLQVALDMVHDQAVTSELQLRCALTIVCAEAGAAGDAHTHVARCREIISTGDDWRGLFGRMARAETAIAMMEGRDEEALHCSDQAIALFRRYSLPWDEAEALAGQGHLQDKLGASKRSAQSLDNAAALYRQLAASLAWASAAQTPNSGRKPSQSPGNAGLTEREIEVLRLLADGETNKSIAGRLVLSVRTVERHIAEIYAKTGAHGRAAATAFALRHGLVAGA
jgi:DNA-binding CsgD family transcriptional regulator